MMGFEIFFFGQGFCLVNFFTGHIGSWTHVQEWTRVQIWSCPVKKFTGHKPGPFFVFGGGYYLAYLIINNHSLILVKRTSNKNTTK